MKLVVFGIVTLCAVALAEVELQNSGAISHHQGPLSLAVALSDSEAQVVDDHVALEGFLGRSLIADAIANTLEGFRDVVINGNDVLPPLDPLVIDKMGPFEYDITGARAKASVENFRAEGLRWYVVDYVTFNALRLAFGAQVTLPWLTVTGSYNAEARVLMLNHRAGGTFRIFINRLEAGADVRLGTNLLAGHLILRDLDLRLFIADLHIQINGMTGSSIINTFINSFIQSLTQEVIQNHLDDICKIISEEIFDTVNDFLKDYTVNDILG